MRARTLRDELVKQIIAQFSAESSRALQRAEAHAGADAVLELVRDASASIERLHPNVSELPFDRYFIVRIPNDAEAEELAAQLRSLPITEAAYVKPEEEPA